MTEEMGLETALAGEELATSRAYPFSSMGLEFMGKPFVAAAEHSKIAFLEGADVWSEISEDVFPKCVSF